MHPSEASPGELDAVTQSHNFEETLQKLFAPEGGFKKRVAEEVRSHISPYLTPKMQRSIVPKYLSAIAEAMKEAALPEVQKLFNELALAKRQYDIRQIQKGRRP